MSTVTRSRYRPQEYTPVIPKPKIIGVVGSRALPYTHAEWVGEIVDYLISKGHRLATGGAMGTDEYVLCRLLRTGHSDLCSIFSAFRGYEGFPSKVRAAVRQFKDYGGHIVWGPSAKDDPLVRTALLMRNVRLVEACYGLVAFVTPDSRGTVFTIQKAAAKRLSLVVFPIGCEAPDLPHVKWVPLRCGGMWEGAVKAVYLQ